MVTWVERIFSGVSEVLNFNLTDENLSEALEIACRHWVDFDPRFLAVQVLKSPEVNIPFDEAYVEDDAGIRMLDNPYLNDPGTCALNYDLIRWEQHREIIDYLERIQGLFPTASVSSAHYMERDGFMEWHTNRGQSPSKPRRIYVTYNSLSGSVFKYAAKGRVLTIDEPIGWYAKVFNVENHIPHCIHAHGPRWSLGIRF